MYVYLVQPCALKGTQRYKLGMSSLDDFSRLKAYGKGTRVLMTIECEDYRVVEQKLMKAFNFAYKRIAGNEYFEIDTSELEMINLFVCTIMIHKNASECEPVTDKQINWMSHKNNLEREPIADKQIDWMSKFAYKK